MTRRWLASRRAAAAVSVVATVSCLTIGAIAASELRAVLDSATRTVESHSGTPVIILGGERERVVRALAIPGVRDGMRELVASGDAAGDLERLGGVCAGRTLCVQPDPPTTRGEARLAARLADERGWTRLTVVTSWWHVRRASLHLEACLGPRGVAIDLVPAGDTEVRPSIPQLLEEVVGSLDARLRPECRDLRP